MSVLVHKAVEPKNLSKAGKQRLAAMLEDPSTLVQPKYDGVYCQIVDEGGPTAPHYVAYSRTGEQLPSVSRSILDFFNRYGVADRYIGELWVSGTSHADINGAARRQYEQPQLKFITFDAVLDERPLPYRERLLHIESLLRASRAPYKQSVYAIGTWDNDVRMGWEMRVSTATAWAKRTDGAYDGLMLKDPNGMFIPGPGKDGEVIKVKPRNSGDFRVIGVVEGKGKAAGMAGALVLDLGGGVTCEVGTGLDDATRIDYWVWWHALEDRFAYGPGPGQPGRIAEIEYLAITKDGKLREPSFKSTRWDKRVADVLPGNIKGAD